MKKQTFLVFIASLILVLVACKRNEPDSYNFEDAVASDSLIVSENGTTLTLYLDIANHVDSANSAETHIITSVLAIAYVDGEVEQKILATADPVYASKNNEYVTFDNEENVLVSVSEFLKTDRNTKLSFVFTESAFQSGNVVIKVTGYDQNGLKTATITEEK